MGHTPNKNTNSSWLCNCITICGYAEIFVRIAIGDFNYLAKRSYED